VRKLLCFIGFHKNWMYCIDFCLQYHDNNIIPYSKKRKCLSCGTIQYHPGANNNG